MCLHRDQMRKWRAHVGQWKITQRWECGNKIDFLNVIYCDLKLLVIKTCRVYNIVFMIADCHAEIISRRCLVEFLYKQIEKFENGCPSPLSIFEAKMEQGKSKGYRLKVTIIRFCIHN